eukprot:scaffold268803_cov20-Tisochrysis_lutea.AAC.1
MQCPWASASQLLSGHSMQCIPGAPCLADNLLPLSCKGQDWQGGISITLLDALDTFLEPCAKQERGAMKICAVSISAADEPQRGHGGCPQKN